MGLTIKVDYPRIDLPKMEKSIHEAMTKFTIESLSIWVTRSTDPIPVWSGASRASFIKLASQAKTQIDISPVVASRIPLGIATSEGVVIATPGVEYGWLWSSDLAYIGIVDENVDFLNAGRDAVERLEPNLPDLEIK